MSSSGAIKPKGMPYVGQAYAGDREPPFHPQNMGPPPGPYYERRGAGPPPGYGPPPYPPVFPLYNRPAHPSHPDGWYAERGPPPSHNQWHSPYAPHHPPPPGPPHPSMMHPYYGEPSPYRGPPYEPGERFHPPEMRYLSARSYDAEESPRERQPPSPSANGGENGGKETDDADKDEKSRDALSMLAEASSAASMGPPRRQVKENTSPERGTKSPLPPDVDASRKRSNDLMTPITSHGRYKIARTNSATADPKPITPVTGGHYPHHHHHSSGPPRSHQASSFPPHHEPRHAYPPTSPFQREWGRHYPPTPPGGPAVVERSSFDSTEGPPRYYSEHDSPYWYSGYGPPPSHRDGNYPPPRLTSEMPPPGYHGPPPPYAYYPPDYPERYTPPPGPYTHVQQPALESKTYLRKKFSWKNFPDLERFLIQNRDDYLHHSSKNYTVAQKQFNNELTKRLIAFAEERGYAFDADDFNFVAIRDRIRCYYKSYVQTIRKRGLQLPGSLRAKNKGKEEEKKTVEEEPKGEDGNGGE